MPSLSKLADECKKCSYVEDCKQKRMVACAFTEIPKLIQLPNTAISRPTNSTPIIINTSVNSSINEQIKKDLYKELNKIRNCAFINK